MFHRVVSEGDAGSIAAYQFENSSRNNTHFEQGDVFKLATTA